MASHLLSLGDSYTIGEGVAEEDRWPVVLCRTLNFPAPRIIAQTGWSTQELLEALDKAYFMHFFDYVTLLVGVNDQYRDLGLEQYRISFEMVLYKAMALCHHQPRQVIVLSIPDYSVTPFAQDKNPPKIHDEINAFNAVNEDVARRAKAHYVNITDLSRQTDPAWLSEDGLHPAARMYQTWVERIIAQVFSKS